ncbi:MAG: class I SAM-dependent methyltransferase, partial [Ignavibacteria bacterium]
DLVFFNPQPSIEYLRELYSSQAGYLPSIEENLRSFESDPSSWRQTADFILQKVYRHLPKQDGQRILDVGSAYGFFLIFAKESGLDAYGLEISSETSRYAKDHGIKVLNTTMVEANFQYGFFDIVTMNNVLEHTLDPTAEVAKAYTILKKSGIIFVAVPNFDSLVAQVDNYLWKMKSWPNHLFYFTEATLSKILEKAGFRVAEVFTHQGESEYNHDVRVVRDRLQLTEENQIREAIRLLWKFQKGQELVVIAKKH